MNLIPVLTNAGLARLIAASHAGLQGEITHIALGTGGYEPTGQETALEDEKARYPVADASRVSETRIHLTCVADGEDEFPIREIGFLLGDGTLLAVHSRADGVLAMKTKDVELLLAFDLVLSKVAPEALKISGSGERLNLNLGEELASLAGALVSTQDMLLQLMNRIEKLERAPR